MNSAATIRREVQRDNDLILNRKIGLYALLQCWANNTDGIVIHHHHLKRFYQVDATRRTRLVTLIEDIGVYFPHCKILADYRVNFRRHETDMSHATIWASRVSFDDVLPEGRMTTADRIAKMKDKVPSFCLFEMWHTQKSNELSLINPLWSGISNPDEAILSNYLIGLGMGRVSHDSVPPFKQSIKRVKPED